MLLIHDVCTSSHIQLLRARSVTLTSSVISLHTIKSATITFHIVTKVTISLLKFSNQLQLHHLNYIVTNAITDAYVGQFIQYFLFMVFVLLNSYILFGNKRICLATNQLFPWRQVSRR